MITAIEGIRARRARSGSGSHPGGRDCALDSWYAALDQEVATIGGRRWTLHVMGIHRAHGKLWIQLQPSAEASASLLLKVGRTTRVEDALEALRLTEWPGGYGHVVDATRMARLASVTLPRQLRRSLSSVR